MLKIEAKTLIGRLKAAMLAASEDTTRSSLNAVLLERRDQTLRAIATDGYRMHVVVLGAENGADASRSVPLSRVEYLVDRLKAASKSYVPECRVLLDDAAIEIKIGDQTEKIVLDRARDPFPPYLQVLPERAYGETTATIGVNARYLADFQRAAELADDRALKTSEKRDPVIYVHAGGEHDPIVLSAQSIPHVAGVVMPCRRGEDPAEIGYQNFCKVTGR